MATVAETTLCSILSNAKIKSFQVSYYCERCDLDFDAKMYNVLVIYKQIEMQFNSDRNITNLLVGVFVIIRIGVLVETCLFRLIEKLTIDKWKEL